MTSADISAARAQFFRLAALVFAHPTPERHAEWRCVEELLRSSAQQGFGQTLPPLPVEREFAELEAAYIDLFQVGRKGRPRVYLNAGEYRELSDECSRPELLLRFASWYRHFGLSVHMEGAGSELPDHLVTQLEFLSWLCQLDAGCDDADYSHGYRLAQADFTAQQLAPLLEQLIPALSRFAADSLYVKAAYCIRDCTQVLLAEKPEPKPSAGIAVVNLWD